MVLLVSNTSFNYWLDSVLRQYFSYNGGSSFKIQYIYNTCIYIHVYCRYGVKHNPNQSIINTCTKHVKLKTEKVQRCASMISTEHDEMKSRETVRHHSGLCYNTYTTDEPFMWESLHEYVISIKKCSVWFLCFSNIFKTPSQIVFHFALFHIVQWFFIPRGFNYAEV